MSRAHVAVVARRRAPVTMVARRRGGPLSWLQMCAGMCRGDPLSWLQMRRGGSAPELCREGAGGLRAGPGQGGRREIFPGAGHGGRGGGLRLTKRTATARTQGASRMRACAFAWLCFCHVTDPCLLLSTNQNKEHFSQPIRTNHTDCVFSVSQSERELVFSFLILWHMLVTYENISAPRLRTVKFPLRAGSTCTNSRDAPRHNAPRVRFHP